MIENTFQDLVESLAAKKPTPGGGAAAALSACLGTALLLMVIRFSRGKKATEEFDGRLAEVEAKLETELDRLMPMAQRDCSSFDQVSKAFGLPKSTDEEKNTRKRAIGEGMLGAMVVPEETLYMVRDVFDTISPVIDLVGKNIASDMGTGSAMLLAGAEGAFLNVRINAAYLDDRGKAEAALEQNTSVLSEVKEQHHKVSAAVAKLMG